MNELDHMEKGFGICSEGIITGSAYSEEGQDQHTWENSSGSMCRPLIDVGIKFQILNTVYEPA